MRGTVLVVAIDPAVWGSPNPLPPVVARVLRSLPCCRACVYVNAGQCRGSRQHGSSRDAALHPSAKDRRQHHRLAVPAAQAVVRRARPARGRRRQHPLPRRSPVVSRARSQVRCGAGVLRVADELPRAAGAFALRLCHLCRGPPALRLPSREPAAPLAAPRRPLAREVCALPGGRAARVRPQRLPRPAGAAPRPPRHRGGAAAARLGARGAAASRRADGGVFALAGAARRGAGPAVGALPRGLHLQPARLTCGGQPLGPRRAPLPPCRVVLPPSPSALSLSARGYTGGDRDGPRLLDPSRRRRAPSPPTCGPTGCSTRRRCDASPRCGGGSLEASRPTARAARQAAGSSSSARGGARAAGTSCRRATRAGPSRRPREGSGASAPSLPTALRMRRTPAASSQAPGGGRCCAGSLPPRAAAREVGPSARGRSARWRRRACGGAASAGGSACSVQRRAPPAGGAEQAPAPRRERQGRGGTVQWRGGEALGLPSALAPCWTKPLRPRRFSVPGSSSRVVKKERKQTTQTRDGTGRRKGPQLHELRRAGFWKDDQGHRGFSWS